MAQSITVSMEGTLLNWLKNVGDAVKSGDVIAEVEADKATVEIEAAADGVLVEQSAKPGDELKEGAVIGSIGAQGEGAAAPAAPAPAASNGAAKKAETPAPQAEAQAPAAPSPAPAAEEEDGNLPNGVKASPVARNLAEEKGIDLARVKGSGPGGRIVKSDVENFKPEDMPAAPIKTAAPAASGIPAASYGMFPEGPDVEAVEVTKLRSRIATRMVESKQQIPHFYVTTEIDVEKLLALRQQLNATIPEGGTKVTVKDLVVKATALTLRQFPNLNSHFYGDRIAHYKRINIGIAVALPNGGLMNVVAHDADKTALGTLAANNKAKIARAREGKVKPDDIQGSTFTVSNLGTYDVDHFIAIVNPPEAGILAIGSAKKVPVVKEDGTLGVGNRMKVTISVDHRVSDGAEGAAFMQAFKQLIEDPMRLLL